MTNDVFYAILKLVSGEEILSKVCAFEENEDIMIVLDNPIIVNIFSNQSLKFPLIKVEPWVSLSNENIFIIKRSNVMTMTEVKDNNLIEIHEKYVKNIESEKQNLKDTKDIVINSNMGYVRKVNEAREIFERLYQSKETPTNFD